MNRYVTGVSLSGKSIFLIASIVFCMGVFIILESMSIRGVAVALSKAIKYFTFGLLPIMIFFTPRSYLIVGLTIGLLFTSSMLFSYTITLEYNYKLIAGALIKDLSVYVSVYILFSVFSLIIKLIIFVNGDYSRLTDAQCIKKLYQR